MSVRTWFTLSALVLIALAVAVTVRFLSPPGAPEIIARAEGRRLEGALDAACWPSRGEHLQCTKGDSAGNSTRLPQAGHFTIVVAFPAQPDGGTLRIVRAGTSPAETVVEQTWRRRFAYRLEPGSYVLYADAKYPRGAYVRAVFPFAVVG